MSDDSSDYLKTRVEDQIKWYSDKASSNKKYFHVNQSIVIIAGALIPIVNVVDILDAQTRLISSILGGIILGITGILQLKKHHENWIMYRSTEETLKKEKFTFLNNAGVYSGIEYKEKNKILVERVESIISNQNVTFFVTHKEKSNTSSD